MKVVNAFFPSFAFWIGRLLEIEGPGGCTVLIGLVGVELPDSTLG